MLALFKFLPSARCSLRTRAPHFGFGCETKKELHYAAKHRQTLHDRRLARADLRSRPEARPWLQAEKDHGRPVGLSSDVEE